MKEATICLPLIFGRSPLRSKADHSQGRKVKLDNWLMEPKHNSISSGSIAPLNRNHTSASVEIENNLHVNYKSSLHSQNHPTRN